MYDYFQADSAGDLVFRYESSGSLKLITRFRFDSAFSGDTTYQLTVSDGARINTYVLTSTPSNGAGYVDLERHVPGLPRDLDLIVPSGGRVYTIRLDAPQGAAVHINPVFTPDVLWTWTPLASLSIAYDDNICSYSPDDLDLFVDQLETERFRIETYDDLVFLPALEAEARRGRSAFRSELDIRYRANLYTRNSIKNYQTLRFELSQNLYDVSKIAVGYSHLPSFYIRHIKDLDLPAQTDNRYMAMEFERTSGWVEAEYSFADPFAVTGGYERSVYDYCDAFNEYDGVASSYAAEAVVYSMNFRMAIKYTFREYDARGYDEPKEAKDSSDDSDASYEQDQYQITLGFPDFQLFGFGVDSRAGFRYAERYYTSEKGLDDDPYHAGREDIITKGWLALRTAVSDRVELSVEAARYDRGVESRARAEIDEEKDYEKYRITFEIEYRL